MVAFRCVWENKLLKILAKSWKSAIAFTYIQYGVTASAAYNSLVQLKKKINGGNVSPRKAKWQRVFKNRGCSKWT